MQPYTIWIEIEGAAQGIAALDVDPYDANSDVIATFADRSRWVTTCITYLNVATRTNKNRLTGENLSAAFLRASDMLLVDQITRLRIKQIVAHLIHEGNFQTIFTRLPHEDPDYFEAMRGSNL